MAAPTQPTTNGDRGTWGPLMTAWMDWVEGTVDGSEVTTGLAIQLDQDGTTQGSVRNDNATDNAIARFVCLNGASGFALEKMGSGYVGTGARSSNVGVLTDSGAAGINIAATGGAGEIGFYTGGSTSAERRVTIDNSGNVGIGTDSPDGKLDVRDGIIVLSDADVTNPMTGVMTSTNAYGKMNPFNSEVGGLRVLGASDAGTGLGISVEGMIGSTNPTDTVPACKFRGSKSDGGTSIAALGDAETVFQFDNFNTSLLTILGNGNVGIGVETPDAKLEVADSLPVLIHLDETDSGGGLLRFTNTTDTDGWYAGITGTEKFAIGRNIDPDIGNALIIQQDGTITFSGNLAADGDVSIGNDTAVDSKFYVLSAISGEYSAKFENTHADGHGIFSKVNNADTNRAALHVANNTQDIFYLTNAGSLSLNGIKSGTDQSDAGAAAGELYQDTNDDNTIKIGV